MFPQTFNGALNHISPDQAKRATRGFREWLEELRAEYDELILAPGGTTQGKLREYAQSRYLSMRTFPGLWQDFFFGEQLHLYEFDTRLTDVYTKVSAVISPNTDTPKDRFSDAVTLCGQELDLIGAVLDDFKRHIN